MTQALWKLATWLSPSYPVGAFTYSHGLETVVDEGLVTDAATARAWIADCLESGGGRSDAILLAEAWRAATANDDDRLDEVAALATALAPSAERQLETEAQGAAFTDVTSAVEGNGYQTAAAYPVAVGRAAAASGVPLEETVLLYLHAMASNLVSACIRLVPLGQTDGQRILAALMPLCHAVRDEALSASIEDVGGCAILSDIASMRHETQNVRLFRT